MKIIITGCGESNSKSGELLAELTGLADCIQQKYLNDERCLVLFAPDFESDNWTLIDDFKEQIATLKRNDVVLVLTPEQEYQAASVVGVPISGPKDQGEKSDQCGQSNDQRVLIRDEKRRLGRSLCFGVEKLVECLYFEMRYFGISCHLLRYPEPMGLKELFGRIDPLLKKKESRFLLAPQRGNDRRLPKRDSPKQTTRQPKNARRPKNIHTPTGALNILITGCSSGFGRDLSYELAGLGHKVFATVRKKNAIQNNSPVEGGARDLSKSTRKLDLHFIELDVTQPENIAATKTFLSQEIGHLDVLINNAGVCLAGFFEDVTKKDMDVMMETNFFGPIALTKAVIPLLEKSVCPALINISSVSSFFALPGLSVYSASKAALSAYFDRDILLQGIPLAVYNLEPGRFETNIYQKNIAHMESAIRREARSYQSMNWLLNQTRSGLFGRRSRNLKPLVTTVIEIISKRPSQRQFKIGSDAWLLDKITTYLPQHLCHNLIYGVLSSSKSSVAEK